MRAARRAFFLAALTLTCAGARAADHDDVYLEGFLGLRGAAHEVSKMQLGAIVGYCPINSLGFGLGFDQALGLNGGGFNQGVVQFFAEGRWFVEPFEISFGGGVQRTSLNAGVMSSNPMILAAADYLWAITPSIALKAELRGQLVFGGTNSIVLGVGGRILY